MYHHPLMSLPGIMATVFKARNTRNVLSAAKLPRSIPIVTYLYAGRIPVRWAHPVCVISGRPIK